MQIRILKPRFLFVAADGPRPGREDDIINCKLTRAIIDLVDWECEVKTLFRTENLGCGYGVCSAISWFFDHVEEGIILEDDCLPDESFFPFCTELLAKYRQNENIYLISGTNMQNGIKRGTDSYYFSNYPITWGWATWKRAWNHFIYDIPNFEETFNSGGLQQAFQSLPEKSYWKKKVKKAVKGKKNIWDYQWWFAIWKNKGMSITPNTNLIVNLGFRNTGAHTFLFDSRREPIILNSLEFPLIHPPEIQVNIEADRFTYKNAYSHSLQRFIRLIKENGIFSILKYSFYKIKIDKY